LYDNFFRHHERLFRDFEREFERENLPEMFPGMRSSIRPEQPMLSWVDDDFFIPS